MYVHNPSNTACNSDCVSGVVKSAFPTVQVESRCDRLHRLSLLLALLFPANVLRSTPSHSQRELYSHSMLSTSNFLSLFLQVTLLNGMGVTGRIVGKVSRSTH